MKINEYNGIELTEVEKISRDEFVGGLRRLLEFYETHPTMPAPTASFSARYYSWCFQPHEQAAMIRQLGKADKLDGGDELTIRKSFSDIGNAREIAIEVSVDKEKTCRRVQVGEKIVQEARPERTLPAQEEVREPVYKWECGGSILEALSAVD